MSLAPQYVPDREVDFLRALENGKQSFRFNRDLAGPLQLSDDFLLVGDLLLAKCNALLGSLQSLFQLISVHPLA